MASKKQVWRCEKAGINYSISVVDNKIEITKHQGTPESFGGNTLTARRFLEKVNLHNHVRDIYGESVLTAVLIAAKEATKKSVP
jgi:hypothetical protein